MSSIAPCKIVIAGDGGTGKSTLITSKNTGKFKLGSNITIGVDFACMDIAFRESKYPFLIYDLGGQQRFQFLHDSYITGTKGAIVLYDLTREKTFDNISTWLALLHKENPAMPILLAGSKCDLVQPEDISDFKKRWNTLFRSQAPKSNVIGHHFISSKSFEGIEDLFTKIANEVLPSFLPVTCA
ncbi:hypothetical protein NEF87_002878 [Candidatus Lokiarchaeum ossiferum]|uniref:GTP-binding protein n=1 Tax=Candidatus Lokiarchaeum ossiferum TaxID=2951803 RepID=A0ABY6HTB5_9ARCH|nr:hypothetical protein NEF87_002878 [Candidatus Lokiarchaeum sp. B-35]